ncbi:TetR/AcrR family transcriptional regulator [Prauserella cavernicola]|uniref:TetR/AcrR family transcriptional regulator C-terminal domain-containing protein n=1 Tax=Prauserella cavernicola TaxID=2800127 RepID=A0A934QSM5_9PSEU|nr:TetR/AcrR family transcriptional regulator [Prauserella cavernicola]MBK1785901.1 TetR/AcrR family transcriptional regulator C-terminal domain-containing protein [Prauserella cavernicola]
MEFSTVTVYGGSGDPKRSLELLWGIQDKPRRGPKPRFTIDDVARTAIAIADADGLAALSMRRVASELGVTAMSLYGYVPSKAELIDVLVDRVVGTVELPEHDGDWRARLERIARANWELSLRHPWLLQVSASRPVLGPNIVAKYDYDLRAVDGIGLSHLEMDLVVTLVADYVNGAARNAVEAAQAREQTGTTDDQWWEEFAPLLDTVFDAERYPTAAVVGAEAGAEYGAASDPERAFEFGLARVLDGLAVLIESKRD